MKRLWPVGVRRAGLGLLLWPALAQAEIPPDAGQLLERSREPVTVQPLQAPSIEMPQEAAPPPPDTARIPVQRFVIRGATVFTEATLQRLVADAGGHELTLAELRALAGRITRFYQARGYLLARAYLPPQEIREGVVEVAVLEGNLEQVASEDSAGLAPGLRQRLNALLTPGMPLQKKTLERVVLLNDALPGIAANARLRAGEQSGGTVVTVETRTDARWAGELSVDNHGDRYTGRSQAGLRLAWNNPTGRGDQLGLRLQSAGEGRAYGHLGYDFALHGPWRANASGSSTRYELGEEFRSLDADGRAHTVSLEVRYPVILRAALRVDAFAATDYLQMVDRIGITDAKRDKSLVDGRFGLALQAADRWRGQSALSLQLTSGHLDIHDRDEQRFDAVSVGSAGGFSKITVAGERRQQLPQAFQLRGTVSLQWAADNLTSAQKLAIAGADGVRAYPAGEAQGDEGQLVSLELWRALPPGPRWQSRAILFADYGRVRFNHRMWTGFAGNTTRELAATGIGFEWTGPHGLGLSAWQAWPLTDAQVTAESDSNHRFWISGRIGF